MAFGRDNVVSGHCLFGLLTLTILLGDGVLFAKFIVALVELRALLLESLKVQILELKLLLESGNLLAILDILVAVALVVADLILKVQHLDDHDVGAVQDKGEEEGETAQIHVALRVELASLNFEALVAHDAGTVRGSHMLASCYVDEIVETVERA